MASTDYIPSIFKILRLRDNNTPKTVCATCPASIWHEDDEVKLVCHCGLMRFISWTGLIEGEGKGEGKVKTACDGREISIARVNAERDVLSG